MEKARPFTPCTGVFTATTGLPCAHLVDSRKEVGQVLLPDDFHLHWYWERYSGLHTPILEPLQIISRGAPKQGKRSTKRIPSGFEATESRQQRCGLCNLPGHDRRSRSCLVRLRQDGLELGLDRINTANSYTNQVELINPELELLRPGLPTPELPTPELPTPELPTPELPNTRPIWP
jgi:hypothetical protein